MPHQPRQFASTVGVAPELLQKPQEKHPAIPVRRAADNKEARPGTLRVGLSTLSPWSYKPDQKQTHKAMFGKESSVEPYSGRLVLPGTQQPAATTIRAS